MSQLAHDLSADWERFKSEYDKGDTVKGLLILGRIAGEVIGMIMLIVGAMKVLTVVTGGIAALGLPTHRRAVHKPEPGRTAADPLSHEVPGHRCRRVYVVPCTPGERRRNDSVRSHASAAAAG